MTGAVTNTVLPLDPPIISKAAQVLNTTTAKWTISVANNAAANAAQAPEPFVITDPIPNAGAVSGSVACTPVSASGLTTVTSCDFSADGMSVVVKGTLAYTTDSVAESASEHVTITFSGVAAQSGVIINKACVTGASDASNCSSISSTITQGDVAPVPELPVPILGVRSLALLTLLIFIAALAGSGYHRKRASQR